MATPPPCFSMSSVTTAALPFGLMCAQTCSGRIPTCFATARAVVFASPVIMFTSMPKACIARIAYTDDGRGLSESAIARTGEGALPGAARDTKMDVLPWLDSSESNAARFAGRLALSDWRTKLAFPT